MKNKESKKQQIRKLRCELDEANEKIAFWRGRATKYMVRLETYNEQTNLFNGMGIKES